MQAMPVLPLIPGTKIITHFFSVIPLDAVGLLPAWGSTQPPKRFTGPIRDQKRLASQLSISSTKKEYVFPDLVEPAPGLNPAGQWTEAYCIQRGVVLVEYLCAWLVREGGASLTPRSIFNHWAPFYSCYDRIEDHVFDKSGVHYTHSDWQFPMTLVLPKNLSSDDANLIRPVFTQAVSLDAPQSATYISTSELEGAITWDGSIFYLRNPRDETVDAVSFLMRIACADWLIHENAMKQALDTLTVQEGTRALLARSRTAVRDFYRAMALFDPYRLSFQESDIEFLRGIDKGWGRTDFHQRTDRLMECVHLLHGLSIDERRDEEALANEKRQNVMNRVMSWLAVVGLMATAATVISTIDFRNVRFDELKRSVIIFGLGFMSATFFIVILRRR